MTPSNDVPAMLDRLISGRYADHSPCSFPAFSKSLQNDLIGLRNLLRNGRIAHVDRLDSHLAAEGKVAIVWTVDDVRSLKGRGNMSKGDALEVLLKAKNDHSADVGFTWQTIEDAADALFPRKKRK